MIEMLVEDDDSWFETGMDFDSTWIDDIIEVLTKAKILINQK
jgi:hypothetical protein